MADDVPKFSDLPLDKNGPHHNAWGLYGKDDQLGTLNRLTDSIVLAAAKSEIQSGVRIGLDWPLDAQGDLPFFGRQAFHKEVYYKLPRMISDDVWTFNTQSSTQWDGFRHFGYQKEQVFYNGLTLDQIKESKNVIGVGEWSKKGIVGRGILLDYHAWRIKQGNRDHNAFETRSITIEDLRAVAKEQGTEIKFGDILLIRSGYMDAYKKLSPSEIEAQAAKYPRTFTGLEQSEEAMDFLWSNFSAAGGDQPSFEAWPSQQDYALHEVMLGGWGMPIGELFDLEAVATHCRKIGRWSFFFTSEPCNVPGGVASPPNALAIF